jgi:hypothetical protein
MQQHVTLYGKAMLVDLSAAAQHALQARTTPLLAEIHLVFGCLIVKRVRFKETISSVAVAVTDKLFVNFRPVRYQKSCRLADIDADENPEDFPLVAERRAYVPDRLALDFRKGAWVGEFTYDRAIASAR